MKKCGPTKLGLVLHGVGVTFGGFWRCICEFEIIGVYWSVHSLIMACLGRTGGFCSQWVFALRQCVGQDRLPQRKERNQSKLKGQKLPQPSPSSTVFKLYKVVKGCLKRCKSRNLLHRIRSS